MRAVVQRVSSASMEYEGGGAAICRGLLVLVGVSANDTAVQAAALARKIAALRVFDDERGRMDRSVRDIGGEILVVSQFTLLGECSHGNRPDFTAAARPEMAEPLYEEFVQCLRAEGIPVCTGRFRATMRVALVNEGPVTIILELKP